MASGRRPVCAADQPAEMPWPVVPQRPGLDSPARHSDPRHLVEGREPGPSAPSCRSRGELPVPRRNCVGGPICRRVASRCRTGRTSRVKSILLRLGSWAAGCPASRLTFAQEPGGVFRKALRGSRMAVSLAAEFRTLPPRRLRGRARSGFQKCYDERGWNTLSSPPTFADPGSRCGVLLGN